jgi:hypothetical protein
MNHPLSLNRKEILILALVLAGLACIFYEPISSYDIWLHLKIGEYIVQHDYVLPKADPFSAEGKALILHEWLSQVMLYVVHNVFGFTGIRIMRVLLQLSALALIFWAALQLSGRFRVALLILLVTAYLFRTRHLIRPELFSLLFFTFLYAWFVTRRRRPRHYDYVLFFLLCVLWVNLHPFMIFTGGIITILIFARVAKKIPGTSERFRFDDLSYDPIRLCLLFLVGSLVNPYGYRIYEYVVGATPVVKQYIQEWQPIFISLQDGAFRSITGWVLFFPFTMRCLVGGIIVLFLVALVGAYARKIRWAVEDVIMGLLVIYMAIKAARFAWLLFVPALLIVKYGKLHMNNGRLPERLKPVMLTVLWGAVCIFCLYWLSQGYHRIPVNLTHEIRIENYPDIPVKILGETNLSGRLYNPACWGGYIMYHLYPDYKVFIDTRTYLHGEARVVDSMMIHYQNPGFEKLVDKYDFDLLLFKKIFRDKRPFCLADWTLIFENANSAMYLRHNDRNVMNIKKIVEYYREHNTPFDPNKGFDLEKLRKVQHLSELYRLS